MRFKIPCKKKIINVKDSSGILVEKVKFKGKKEAYEQMREWCLYGYNKDGRTITNYKFELL